MAAGRAIVAPDQEDISKVLRDGGTARLFDPVRPDAMRQAILRLAGSATLRQRLGSWARAEIVDRDYTWGGPWRRVAGWARQSTCRVAPHLDRRVASATLRGMRNFSDLTEREVLALAIANEEEDNRIYTDIAEGLRGEYPASANVFTEMAEEESEHRQRLLDLYRAKFGEHIPLIRRHDVRGFIHHKPVWQIYPLNIDEVRHRAESMEIETQRFYRRAAARSEDVSVRKLLGDLAAAEVEHEHRADQLRDLNLPDSVVRGEDARARASFVLRVIQPGLAGLMDGSVSTLAPVFAAAFATGKSWDAFLVGMAASIGAGISMAFAEALSDNGSLTGRGAPIVRGSITGAMTTLGGIGHTLPFLIPSFWVAMSFAMVVVVVELAVISWVRWKYMDTPPVSAAFQVAFGGALVFAAGILIGSSG
jgi:erythrin-vacuolar iron transport family protein